MNLFKNMIYYVKSKNMKHDTKMLSASKYHCRKKGLTKLNA